MASISPSIYFKNSQHIRTHNPLVRSSTLRGAPLFIRVSGYRAHGLVIRSFSAATIKVGTSDGKMVMCGRIKQARDPEEYQQHIRWRPRTALDVPGLRFNVPPGTRPIALHRLGGGAEQADRLFWGYKPPWYRRGPASNARLDTVLMAGITAWQPGKEVLAETGFAIVTDDSAGGMVDIHDRRPVCLAVDDAMAWVDPDTPVEAALELLSTPRPESAFRWWQVTRAMGNSRYQMPDAAKPI